MEEYGRPSFRSSGAGERRMEIVSGKGFNGNQVYSVTGPRSPESVGAKPWGYSDGEMKRRKRIAKYKVYTIEGRLKASVRSGFRWIKTKCSEFIHGY